MHLLLSLFSTAAPMDSLNNTAVSKPSFKSRGDESMLKINTFAASDLLRNKQDVVMFLDYVIMCF